MGGGDVDGEIEAHLVKTVINSRGRQNASGAVFDAEAVASGGEVL